MDGGGDAHTPEQLFEGHPEGLAVLRAVERAVTGVGEAEVRVTKSQVSFRRRRGFAFVWRPGQYVASTVPAVLSIALPDEIRSDRFKEVAHPSARTWMHHLEVRSPDEVDAEVRAWLGRAYDAAG